MKSSKLLGIIGYNSSLYNAISDSLPNNILISRYSDNLSSKNMTLLIFNDVPSDDINNFINWIEDLDKKNFIDKIIFCSSFVCNQKCMTSYQERKLFLEESLYKKFGSKALGIRFKNLLFPGSQWFKFNKKINKKIVINFSTHDIFFPYMLIDDIKKTFLDSIYSDAMENIPYKEIDMSKESLIYLKLPIFQNVPLKSNLILRLINKYLPVLIISGTEYNYYEN